MANRPLITVDGNEAAASVAHRTNEVIAIYPITPFLEHGGVGGRVGRPRAAEHLGDRSRRHRNAVRRRSRRGRSRCASGGRAHDDLHRVAGSAPDDPRHVQGRGRADGERTASTLPRGAWPRTPCSIFGDHSDVMAVGTTGVRADGLRVGPGSPRPGAASARPPAFDRGSRSFTSSMDSARPMRSTKIEELDDDDLRADDRRGSGMRPPGTGAHARSSRPPRHRAEPRRLLPGARGCNLVLRQCPELVQQHDGRFRRSWSAASTTCSTTWARPTRSVSSSSWAPAPRPPRRRSSGCSPKGEKVGVAEGPALPPVPDRKPSSTRFRRASRRSPCSTARRNRARSGEPLYQDVVDGAPRGDAPESSVAETRRSSAAATGSPRRNSPRPWSRPVFDELPRSAPKNHFTVGINDDVTHTQPRLRPRFRHRAGRRRARRYSTGSGGRHGRRQQELDQDHRRGDGQLRAGLLRLRLEEGRVRSRSPTCASARGRSAPRTSSAANFIACHQFVFLERYDMLDHAVDGGDIPPEQPLRPGRGLGPICRRGPETDHREEAEVLRDRRLQGGARTRGMGGADQHDHADLLLRDLRRAATEEAIVRSRTRSRRPTAKKGDGGRQEKLRGRRRTPRPTSTRSSSRRRSRATCGHAAGRLRSTPRIS